MSTKSIILGGVLALLTIPTFANVDVPQKNSNCPSLIEPPQSGGYYMSQDCTTAYVLPPRTGILSLVSYSSSVSSKTCEALETIENRNLLNQEYREIIATEIKAKAKAYSDLSAKITSGNIPSGTTEDEMKEKLENLLKEVRTLKTELNDDIINYVEEKSPYAVMEGGRGTFHLVSGFSELMNDFIKLNEGKNINFRRMPIKKNMISVVDAVFKGDESKMEMRAIKRLLMAEVELPVGNTAEAIANPDVARDVRGVQNSIFGDAISGAIETSVIGDCAIQRARAENSEADPLRSDITATGKYEYEVQVNRNYKVTYNFKELVRIFRQTSRRGGFFSRRTMSTLIDERSSSTWIEFHTANNDTEFNYTEEEKKEIKKDFLDRALRQIVDLRSDGKASALALLDPSGKNGAQAAGDALGKCPHLYCQIGSAGFKVLDAIFGSESASSELIKRITGESIEISDEDTMVTLTGTSAF